MSRYTKSDIDEWLDRSDNVAVATDIIEQQQNDIDRLCAALALYWASYPNAAYDTEIEELLKEIRG